MFEISDITCSEQMNVKNVKICFFNDIMEEMKFIWTS